MTNLEKQALLFATKAHKGQLRKYSKVEYIAHPKRIAERLRATKGIRAEVIAAAYLHDVVEDTPVTLDEISASFGPIVARLVDELTDKYTSKAYPRLNRAERKRLEIERIAKISREAQIIKLADVVDNLSEIDPSDPFAEVFLKERWAYLDAIGGASAELFAEVEAAANALEKKIAKAKIK